MNIILRLTRFINVTKSAWKHNLHFDKTKKVFLWLLYYTRNCKLYNRTSYCNSTVVDSQKVKRIYSLQFYCRCYSNYPINYHSHLWGLVHFTVQHPLPSSQTLVLGIMQSLMQYQNISCNVCRFYIFVSI